jgi:hypothetical protein
MDEGAWMKEKWMKYLNEKKFDPSKSDTSPLRYQYGLDFF